MRDVNNCGFRLAIFCIFFTRAIRSYYKLSTSYSLFLNRQMFVTAYLFLVKTFCLFAALFGFLATTVTLAAQTPAVPEAIILWPNGAPGALGRAEKDIPTLTPFFSKAKKATGAALVICPGGGYAGL